MKKQAIHFTVPAAASRKQFASSLVAECFIEDARVARTHEYLRVDAPPPDELTNAICSTWARPNKYHYPMRIMGIMVFADRRGLYDISLSTSRSSEEPVSKGHLYLSYEQMLEVHKALWEYYKNVLTPTQQTDELGERVYACVNQLFDDANKKLKSVPDTHNI